MWPSSINGIEYNVVRIVILRKQKDCKHKIHSIIYPHTHKFDIFPIKNNSTIFADSARINHKPYFQFQQIIVFVSHKKKTELLP